MVESQVTDFSVAGLNRNSRSSLFNMIHIVAEPS